MTPNQMIAMVRRFINDEQATGFTAGGNMEQPEGTQELLTYLDRAVDEYSKLAAGRGDIRLMKTFTPPSSGMQILPADFLKVCGEVPFSMQDSMQMIYHESGAEITMPVRYFARLPYVSNYGMDDYLPYARDQEIAICALAAIYALNKHEYNVSQDLMMLGYGAVNNANVEQ